MDISEQIRARIQAEGPLPFDRFMELALYAPDGFFAEPPIGPSGHFITSPHVHPVFGYLLGQALEGIWSLLGESIPFKITEVGAGDGTLARQLIDALPGIPLQYRAAERSARARAELATIEPPLTLVESFDDLATFNGVVVANELMDNLPFRIVRGVQGGIVEVLVDVDPKDGAFVPREAAVPIELSEYAPALEPGEETTVSLETIRFVSRMAAIMLEGYVILIDYGQTGGGEAHGYRNHRVVEDVLSAPGTCDITAGVDFDQVVTHAQTLKFEVYGPVSQHDALVQLGFHRWNGGELTRQQDLLNGGEGVEAVRAWGDRQAASLLIDPAGLGRSQWLVLASPGLPRPPWTLPLERQGSPLP